MRRPLQSSPERFLLAYRCYVAKRDDEGSLGLRKEQESWSMKCGCVYYPAFVVYRTHVRPTTSSESKCSLNKAGTMLRFGFRVGGESCSLCSSSS